MAYLALISCPCPPMLLMLMLCLCLCAHGTSHDMLLQCCSAAAAFFSLHLIRTPPLPHLTLID
ncbi:hypothetical protein DM02DRAFT_610198 [Periconia macrospinosa]|uniref:Secreted protein n=1 Tax=Periconia macrospinosa TaxID=97972 RepID=A0A2V1E5I7_9PLEO|nr:hypothetical protein DM02DRAFT_610198 [Periconia macrospinosa]